MYELTVGPKGQITLPKVILEHLGAKPGDKLLVEVVASGKIILSLYAPKTSRPKRPLGTKPKR